MNLEHQSGFLPVHKFVYRFQCHFLVCQCILIYFISVSAHSLFQLSVCKSAFLFVCFSPSNGSLVDLNITTAVPKFRRHKVEPTALYHPISLLLHHALTLPLPPLSFHPLQLPSRTNFGEWISNDKNVDVRRESWKIEEFLQDKEKGECSKWNQGKW